MTIKMPIEVHKELQFLQIYYMQREQQKVTLQDTFCYAIKDLSAHLKQKKDNNK